MLPGEDEHRVILGDEVNNLKAARHERERATALSPPRPPPLPGHRPAVLIPSH